MASPHRPYSDHIDIDPVFDQRDPRTGLIRPRGAVPHTWLTAKANEALWVTAPDCAQSGGVDNAANPGSPLSVKVERWTGVSAGRKGSYEEIRRYWKVGKVGEGLHSVTRRLVVCTPIIGEDPALVTPELAIRSGGLSLDGNELTSVPTTQELLIFDPTSLNWYAPRPSEYPTASDERHELVAPIIEFLVPSDGAK